MAVESVDNAKVLEFLLALKKALGTTRQIIVAIVDEINDDDTFDCTPIGGSAKYLSVQTKLEQTEKNAFYIVPEKGSYVLLASAITDEQQAFLLYASKPLKIVWISPQIEFKASSNGTVEVNADKVVFNKGANGGLVVADSLASFFNDFIANYNAHTHASSGAPVAIPLRNVVASQFENSKIKH